MRKIFSADQFLEQVADALPVSSKPEQARLLEHARAWADVNNPAGLPAGIEARLQFMEAQCGCATR